MNRRQFVSRIVKAATVAAIAPAALAKVPLPNPVLPSAISFVDGRISAYWLQTTRVSQCYSDEYLAAFRQAVSSPECNS